MSVKTYKQEYIDKAVRLIDYHTKLAALKSKSIKDINSYESILWVDDIPHLDGCYAITWGSDEAYEDDTWIEITVRSEPDLPPIPEQCRPWVVEKSLMIKTDIPLLLNEITVLEEIDYDNDIEQYQEYSITLKLVDHPEVQQLWDNYIEITWLPWVEEHDEWESINRIYEQLFNIHQTQVKQSEEYELVLGIGLLTWQKNLSIPIRRHVVTTNAQLEFEPRRGCFRVRPTQDGFGISPEFDMIDPEDIPINLEKNSKESFKKLQENIWSKESISNLLHTVVHTLDSQGEYFHVMKYDGRAAQKPIISYSPALILRKRSTMGLRNTFEIMKQQILETQIIPGELQDLSEINDESNVERDDQSQHNSKRYSLDNEIYFPKPANDEQRAIINKINSNGGVLVQGPPGTGKSHTIANLISHLLATGKRTLVTAKTPRALMVLEKLIPEELRSLCISLLGTGIEEKQSMEKSINGILSQNEKWDQKTSDQAIQKYQNQLEILRAELSATRHQISQIRESETHQIEIVNGSFKGTASEITQTLNEKNSIYEWFIDDVAIDSVCSIDGEKIVDLYKNKRLVSNDDYLEIDLCFPNQISTPENISKLFEEENNFQDRLQLTTYLDNHDEITLYNSINSSCLHQLQEALQEIQQLINKLANSPSDWIKNALQDAVYGNLSTYELRKNETEKILETVSNYYGEIAYLSINIPPSADVNELYNHLQVIVQYAEINNQALNSIFLPSRIRRAKAYIKKSGLQYSDQSHNEATRYKYLLWFTYVLLEVARAKQYWEDILDFNDSALSLQIAGLQESCKAVELLASLASEIKRANQLYGQYTHVKSPIWLSLDSIELERDRINHSILTRGLKSVKDQINQNIEELSKYLQSNNSHPISQAIIDSINNRNFNRYLELYNELNVLNKKKHRITQLDIDFAKTLDELPILFDRVSADLNNDIWYSRFMQIKNAWIWKQAKKYMVDFLDRDLIPDLSARCDQIENEISRCIEELAALKAWTFCFSRLQDKHRRHMVGWQQSMRKLGKATGKYAPVHRKTAQDHLNECRDAVPAWIMPLHRIWDTVRPSPELFDVVIIDEASQCGFESLPLYYLAKKIIIVGDDRQISPEEGFVSGDSVIQHKRDLLYDFAYASSFDIGSSLFDQAKLRYGTNRVTLREHFRCMPEIIRFSNIIAYPDTPLIPLRQYGKERLEPLKSVFVSDGFREGNGSRTINRPEAKKIVSLIEEMCNDERYKDKTIGVVVLQGEEQGKLIETELLKRIGAEEFENRRIVCGNSYSFQGDERDVMILSMVTATNARITSLTKEADKRRFNVASSRARDQMILVHSVTTSDLGPNCLRRKLIQFFQEARRGLENENASTYNNAKLEQLIHTAATAKRSIVKPPQPFDSWFEVDVFIKISSRGYNAIPQYEVAGKYIDIVIVGGNSRFAVECDGDHWHGPDQYENDMHRQRILERCGWRFFRIRASMFYLDYDKSLAPLWNILDDMHIYSFLNQSNKLINEKNEGDVEKAFEDKSKLTEQKETSPTFTDIHEPDTNTSAEQHQKPSSMRVFLLEELKNKSQFDMQSGIKRKYARWPEQVYVDPREINIVEVGDNLLEIVKVESPIHCYRAYQIYANAAGIGRISNEVRGRFDKAIKSKISAGKIISEDELKQFHISETFIRAESTLPILLRERGDRRLDEIPPSEIALLAAFICQESKMYVYSRPDLLRIILEYYGLIRLTSKAQNYINDSIEMYDVMGISTDTLKDV